MHPSQSPRHPPLQPSSQVPEQLPLHPVQPE
nr:MAG TPA: hypothetical protein [Herelleviridae sp.]DAJ08782.1 MAG TPA: hypothetical protein [Caudoviricetes sp.]DAR53695.1 MAG TPA: hypothetical protein [Caudoviricetes sp.]